MTLLQTLNFVHLSYECHMHPCFRMAPLGPPFGLSRFFQPCLGPYVVRVWFILECHRGHFPSCWHHAIGKKWGHPEVLAQLEFIGVCLSSEHLGLFWPYLPHPNSELCTVFFHGLLILQGKLYQNFIIFINRFDQLVSGSTGSSSQLVWSTGFDDFEAQFLYGLDHKLQIGLGLYCGSILGLVLGSLQPTMNPYGSLVVKKTENLKESACMENW